MSFEFKFILKYIQSRRSFDVSSGCCFLTFLKNFLSALLNAFSNIFQSSEELIFSSIIFITELKSLLFGNFFNSLLILLKNSFFLIRDIVDNASSLFLFSISCFKLLFLKLSFCCLFSKLFNSSFCFAFCKSFSRCFL